MLAFSAAVFFMVITPGPGVLSTAGVGSGFGFRAGLSWVAGLLIGTNLVALAVVTGVAAAILSVPLMRTVLMVLSGAYLVYLAARIAFSGSKLAFMEKARPPGVLDGVVLQLLNPKAYATMTALYTGFAFWPESLLVETAIKFTITNTFWIPIHLLWLWLGVTLKRMDLPARVNRVINVFMAMAMLAVVALMALA